VGGSSSEKPEGAPSHPTDPPVLGEGIELLGEYEGSGHKEPLYIARRADGQVIQLTHLLYLVAAHVDGRRDEASIAAKVSEEFGRRVSADNVAFLVDKKLRPLGVVAAPDGSTPRVRKPDPLLALRFKTVLVPERAVNFVTTLCRPLFWPPVILVVLAGFVALDVWYFGIHGIAQGVRSAIYEPATILLIYGLLVLSVGWHEVGHATACRYGGAQPGIIGFGIYVVWPAFYTDVTDAYRLGRAGRVRTDLGGVYFNVIFALATTGVYLATHLEPLLTVVLMQHILILYQFMPFLRLDGYYVVSDLTGVPDLFARIAPTLRSLVPWRRSDAAVTALKPWVRVVVTAWVCTTVPLLLYGFTMMVITAPRVIATTFDSLLLQWGKVAGAVGRGEGATATAGALQAAMLALPVGGMGVTMSRLTRQIVSRAFKATRGKPLARSITVLTMASLGAAAVWLLLPNGEYKPIQPGERGTLQESFAAASQLVTGRPGLTEDRQKELGGAPFTSRPRHGGETGEASSAPASSATDDAAATDDGTEDMQAEEQPNAPGVSTEESPTPNPETDGSPTPDPEEVEPTPTPTPADEGTPTPEPTASPGELPQQ
jgi:putative peptide zinc metalloprotease protein